MIFKVWIGAVEIRTTDQQSYRRYLDFLSMDLVSPQVH